MWSSMCIGWYSNVQHLCNTLRNSVKPKLVQHRVWLYSMKELAVIVAKVFYCRHYVVNHVHLLLGVVVKRTY